LNHVRRLCLLMPVDIASKTILLISHVNPVDPSAGNERRVLNLIRWLKSEGFRVELLLNTAFVEQKVMCALNEIVDVVHTRSSLSLLEKLHLRFIASEHHDLHPVTNKLSPLALLKLTSILCARIRPIAVIAEYIFTAPCLSVVPQGTLKLIDTHDLYSRRDASEEHYCTLQQERELLLNGDVIMAIQKEEAGEFIALVPERKVVTVGVDFEVIASVDEEVIIPDRILLVGSDNAANIDGLHRFFCFAWPKIRTRCPLARLRIVGKVGLGFSCSDDRVDKVGWVDSLENEYAQASVVINPTIHGTGLKIKTVEALCNGKPLVATSNSVAGLIFGDQLPCIVSDDWSNYADSIVRLLNNRDARLKLQNLALNFSIENFTSNKVYAELSVVLNAITENT